MKIKTVHAHFLIQLKSYAHERIGFSVKLEDGETPEQIIPELRNKAIQIIGKRTSDLYDEKNSLEIKCSELEYKLEVLRKEWDATATFLKAQGLNPDAPSMPQFQKLLTSVTVESEIVTDDEDDEDGEDDEDEYSDDI